LGTNNKNKPKYVSTNFDGHIKLSTLGSQNGITPQESNPERGDPISND